MNSNYSTLLLLLIKEMRYERGIHQGLLAQAASKSPSAWTKIENGQSPLTMDTFFAICSALQASPAFVMSLLEQLIRLFNSQGVCFHALELDDGDDELLPLVLRYFNSPGYEALKLRPFERISASGLSNPFSQNLVPTVVHYCCNPAYRDWLDRGAPLQTSQSYISSPL